VFPRRLEMQLPLTLRRPVGPHAVRAEEAREFRAVSKCERIRERILDEILHLQRRVPDTGTGQP
jgi:hypothetical protein